MGLVTHDAMHLYLLRHGPAEENDPRRWPDDDDRPLSREGVTETRRAVKGFCRLAGKVQCVITSPAARAHATAELLLAALVDPPSLTEWRELRPGMPASPVLNRLHRTARLRDSAVVVGHEPTLSELAGLALTGEAVSVIHLARAGAASLDFPRAVIPGGAQMDWLFTRKQLMRSD